MTLLTGCLYTLVVTGVGQTVFDRRADGSPVTVDGSIVGSELLAQPFVEDRYFHPRPSAVGHDATLSGGSNLGPNNPDLLSTVVERVAEYRALNGVDSSTPVPVDAVTTSGSGLDPHISVANARIQAARVAEARALELGLVLDLIDAHTTGPFVGFLSEPVVNVLTLNVALDEMAE
jgi:K+-transporting ATPase ATPase C chain